MGHECVTVQLIIGRVKAQPVIEALKPLPRVNEFVFLNQFGRLISATQITDGIIRLQNKHPEMKKWTCHDLRLSVDCSDLEPMVIGDIIV
jgi:hypothetical protein